MLKGCCPCRLQIRYFMGPPLAPHKLSNIYASPLEVVWWRTVKRLQSNGLKNVCCRRGEPLPNVERLPIVQYLGPCRSTFSVLHYTFVHWSRNSLCISFYAPVSDWFIQSVFYHLPTPAYKVHPCSSAQSSFQRDNDQRKGTMVCLCVKRRFSALPQRELPAII